MTSRFHHFVEEIVKQTDGNQLEKDDLYDELINHLKISSAHFLKEGFNEKDAERKAMEHFGDANDVGSQIQQEMFPFRREMMLTLAISSFLFSFSVYLCQLFLEGDAHIIWLVLSIIVSSLVFIIAIRPIPSLNRRLWLNAILIIHIFIYFMGILLASGIENSISIVLTLLSWLIVLLGIVLIYRTTIYDYQPSKQKLQNLASHLHALNITAGIIVIGATLFFLWGILAFSGEYNVRMLIIFIPLLIWIIAYLLQMNFLKKGKKKLAYAVAIVPFLLLTAVVTWLSLSL